jgi:hypothetical protein
VTVVLAFLHGGNVRTDFMLSVLDADRAGQLAGVAEKWTGPFISKVRSDIAARFVASGHDWLWFVDSDITFSLATLPALLKHADPEDRPVLAGLYLLPAGQDYATGSGQTLQRYVPALYQPDRDAQGRFGFTSLTTWPEDDLLQVGACGAGCLLIHRSVFTRLDQAAAPGGAGLWFAERIIDGRPFGEDMSFCTRLADAGIPLYAHTGIRAGHVKLMQLGEPT